MNEGYAIWNADSGRVKDVYDNVVDAIEAHPDAGIDPALEEEESPRDNPLPVFEGPRKYVNAPKIALKAAQLPRISEDAFKMSYEEAYHRLKHLRPKIEKHPGEFTDMDVWLDPRRAAKSLLGGNVKLDKKAASSYYKQLSSFGLKSNLDRREQTESRGLALAPYWSGFSRKSLEPQLAEHSGKPNFCAYSTPGCRAGCLVGTGKNFQLNYVGQKPYNGRNYAIKRAKSRMLVEDPDAFGAMLIEATRAWRQMCVNKGIIPSARLNVVSDIPWEIVFPELFEFYSDVQWYDYTKVPNRAAGYFSEHPNYDLTYSYAGRGTIDRTVEEFDRGLRVAVVFLTKKHHLPRSFKEIPVIDGDLHDIRWIDPPQVVVGLAYKRPAVMKNIGKGSGGTLAGTADKVKDFIVPVEEIDGQLVVVETPRQTDQGDHSLGSFDAPMADEVLVS